MHSALPSFRQTQQAFAAFIRAPDQHPVPAGVAPHRMAMYRELFFNNIDSFLAGNFPVLRSLLDDAQWYALAQDFYQTHRCSTPHFSQIAEEFLDYLQNERQAEGDYPFLLELAHYEWVEMALAIAQDQPCVGDSDFVDTLSQRQIILSPLAWPLLYQYPVEKISPAFLPATATEQPSYLLVYRDRDDQVHFMQLSALTFALVQLLETQSPIITSALLAAFAQQFPALAPEQIQQHGLQLLQDMARKSIVIPAS